MAEMNNQSLVKRKVRARKLLTKIDMTPMVDLAFLLLTFFILTTTLHEPKTLDLVMPSEPGYIEPNPVNNAITLILSGENKVYYYEDELETSTVLKETDFGKVRQLLQAKNQPAVSQIDAYKKSVGGRKTQDTVKLAAINEIYRKKGINVIIKYDSLATYRNTVDMVDEMDICGVPSGKYAIVKKLEPAEKKLLDGKYGK
jgi:biopolymer transport protein ExbD